MEQREIDIDPDSGKHHVKVTNIRHTKQGYRTSPSFKRNKYTEDKIEVLHPIIPEGNGIARDLFSLHRTPPSTAFLLKEKGYKVYGWGDEVYMLDEPKINGIKQFTVRDVIQLPFNEEPGDNTLGDFALVSIIDGCGLTDFEYTFETAQHSGVTLLTLTKSCSRHFGSNHDDKELWDYDYPSSIRGMVGAYSQEAIRRDLTCTLVGETSKVLILKFIWRILMKILRSVIRGGIEIVPLMTTLAIIISIFPQSFYITSLEVVIYTIAAYILLALPIYGLEILFKEEAKGVILGFLNLVGILSITYQAIICLASFITGSPLPLPWTQQSTSYWMANAFIAHILLLRINIRTLFGGKTNV